jgi:hypothetical protein
MLPAHLHDNYGSDPYCDRAQRVPNQFFRAVTRRDLKITKEPVSLVDPLH